MGKENIQITIANNIHSQDIIDFFKKHLDANDPSIPREFHCPSGIKSSIQRHQMIIGLDDNDKIISALRFYPRKKDGVISVYQHAVNKDHNKDKLLRQMLKATNGTKFEFL